MPETVAVTAKRRIAPTAISKMDVPTPMSASNNGRFQGMRYRMPTRGKHRNPEPANPLLLQIHEKTTAKNTHHQPGSAGCAAHIRVRTQGPDLDHPGRRKGDRRGRPDTQLHARRDEVTRRGRG